MTAQSKPDTSKAAVSAQSANAAPTPARALAQPSKTLIGVPVVAVTKGLPPPAAGLPLFPAERLAEVVPPRSRAARPALRRSGQEVHEETHEVSLCDTLPASESIVAALADVAEPTQDISLQELAVAAPGVANDVLAAAPSLSIPVPAPSGRSKRWLWAAGALPLLLAAGFFILQSRPPAETASKSPAATHSEPAATAPRADAPLLAAAATAELEVPSAPDKSVTAAPEPAPAPEEAETGNALPAETPSDEVEEAAAAETGAAPHAVDRAALARADSLAAQGSALRKRRKLGPARAKYRAALEVYPGHPRALYGLTQLAIQLHDGKQAVQFGLELVKTDPDEASYLLLLGDAYRAAGKRKEAREAWQNAARQGNTVARKRLK